MATFISKSPEDTRAFGESWGKKAKAGCLIGLTGDLGAGKTEFVKGLALGLGITNPVLSPTFALVHEYTGGRLGLFHLDLYRLESPLQVRTAGLEDYFYNSPGVTVVEWIERWLAPQTLAPTPDFRHLIFETVSETERRITYEQDRTNP